MEERFPKYFWWSYRKRRQSLIFAKNLPDTILLVLETDLKTKTANKKNREKVPTPINY